MKTEDNSILPAIKKYILEEISYFENATYFSMSYVKDGAYKARSFPTEGEHYWLEIVLLHFIVSYNHFSLVNIISNQLPCSFLLYKIRRKLGRVPFAFTGMQWNSR